MTNINKDVPYNDFFKYFIESVSLEQIRDKIISYSKELDLLESKNIHMDMDQFQTQMILFQSIIERCSSMYWDMKNMQRRYDELFEKVLFLRTREEDIQSVKCTQPEKKQMAELDLLKFIELSNKIDSLLDRMAMFKESYQQKHNTLSRVFSYLQYKTQLKEVQ